MATPATKIVIVSGQEFSVPLETDNEAIRKQLAGMGFADVASATIQTGKRQVDGQDVQTIEFVKKAGTPRRAAFSEHERSNAVPHARPTRRGRVSRACRLVSGVGATAQRRSPLHSETAGTYLVALDRVRDLRRLFPAFYWQHIANRNVTPRALQAAVIAFLSLVNNELFAIEDIGVMDIPMDPLRALAYTEDGSRDPLIELEEVASWLAQPRPVLYGVGTEGILEDETPQQLLTLALWHLCRETNWSIGVDVGDVIGFSYVEQDLAEYLVKLPVLPRGTTMEHLVTAIKLPPWSEEDDFDELICYPFARTDNPMANTTNYEVDIVYGGQMDGVWEHALEIAATAREAAELAARYGRWARAVADDPKRELRRLAKALHTAAEAAALTKPASPSCCALSAAATATDRATSA